jgi:hypothetical protein
VGPRAGLDDVETRKFLTLPGIEPRTPRSSSLYPVAIPTGLSRLLTYNYNKIKFIFLILSLNVRASFRAVRLLLLTLKTRLQRRVTSRKIRGGRNDIGAGSLRDSSVSSANNHSTIVSQFPELCGVPD